MTVLRAEILDRESERVATPAQRSLAPTLVFSLAAHLLIALVGILAVPVYLRLLGADGYGLFGFYVVLQSWMLLFDMGLSPAVARQLSLHRAGAVSAHAAAGLMRAAEALFLLGGLAAAGVFLLGSGWLASHWLGASRLPHREILRALELVGCLMAGRWMAGLYQTALVGLERQTSANLVSLTGAVARAGASVAVLILIAPTPVVFFSTQAILTLAEAVASRLILSGALPRGASGQGPNWRLLSREFRFAAALAASAAIATMINQADKLALSHVLALGEFGRFSLVISICSGIALVVPPFAQAFQPRLTGLLAQGRGDEFAKLYRLSIALIIALIAGLAGTIAFQPELVVFGWTGDRLLAHHLAPILSPYALGAGVSAFLFVPFFMQYAQGSMRLHLTGNLLFGAIWIPALWWTATVYGPVGAGLTWLGGNLLFLVLWVPVVHRRWLSRADRAGLAWRSWGQVALLGALLSLTRLFHTEALDRLGALVALAGVSAIVTAAGLISSSGFRAYIVVWLGHRRGST